MRQSIVLLFFFTSLFGGQPSPVEQAIIAAQRAIEKDPGQPDGYNALAMALARRARDTADTTYYDRAEAAIKRSLAVSPDNFEALKAQCWIRLGRHEFADALVLAKQLNRRVPDDPAMYGFLVDANAELGNYKEAEEAAQWMLDLSRNGVPGLTRAAYLREIFGDRDGAMELMRMAYTRTHPAEIEDRAWMLVHIGQLFTAGGKLKEAAEVLNEALTLVPDYHYALAALAKVRTAEDAHSEAVKLMRRRYEVAPHPENLFDVAAALHNAGKRAEAMKTFLEFEKLALAESAGWDNANRELISYYADYALKPAKALSIAKLEIARRRDVATIDAYAWALHRSGMHREAREEIKKALAIGAADPNILKHARAIEARDRMAKR
ncbi:MAG: hypothetical protein WD696_12180 [Bryobacteraceae bacterium]